MTERGNELGHEPVRLGLIELGHSNTNELCVILNRFSQVNFVNNSLSHMYMPSDCLW